MATIIKIKRSSGTSQPNLGQGELGYSWGSGNYTDGQGATVASYGKLYLGTGTETSGIAANIEVIGGKYFTDMLDHGHGTVTANSATIVDSAKKVDEWNVDNITLNGNTISTTNSNGDLTIDTNGTGDVIVAGSNTVGSNLFSITDGTNTRFSVDSFSGATTITSGTLTAAEELLNISSTWNNSGSTFYGIKFDVTNTASAAASRLIDLSVGGSSKFNVDLNGNINFTGSLSSPNGTDFSIPDNTANAFRIKEGNNEYLNITTTNDSESITLGNNLSIITQVIQDNLADAFVLKEGTAKYIAVDTTDGSELVKFQTGNVAISNDLAVNGGDITTTSTTATVFDSTATTLSIGGAANTLNLSNTTTGGKTVNIGTAATAGASTLTFGGAITGNIFKISGTTTGTINLTSDVTTGTVNAYTGITTGTLNLATGGASTTNIGGAAATVNIGTTGGNSILEVRGNSTTGTATIQTNSGVTTANVFNTQATTGNLFGAATTVAIANTGTGARTINLATAATGGASTFTYGGAVTGNIFKIASTAAGTVNVSSDVTTGTVNLFTGVTTGTVNIATGGASTTIFGGTNGNSAISIRGNGTGGTASITSNVTTGSVNFFAGVTGTINYGGSSTTHDFGDLVVKGNTIYTDAVGATQLILDPFPAGGDDAGEVLIRGNLTVAGTTTTVNSTEVSVNDPVFTIGDTVSAVVITANATSGATSLTVDSPVGIVEGSTITGTNIAASTTISNVRTRFYTSAQMAGTQTAGTTVIYTYNTDTTSYEAIGVFVSKGANFLEIDLNANIALREDSYYVGLQLRDNNTGSPNNVTIARDPANNKVFTTGATLTISTGTTAGITAPQEVTISQGADDNMDRGIQFKYYSGSVKTGFFGYDESGITEGASTTNYFTYIPDATNTNNVFTGTVGSAYFKTVKVDDGVTNGIAFYDTYKKLTTTVAAGTNDATTSNQILTVNGSGVPVWTTTLDGGTY